MMGNSSLPVLFRETFTTQSLENLFHSYSQKDTDEVISAINLALEFIEKGEPELLSYISDRFLAILLTFLRAVDENVLTNRILITYRKEIEKKCRDLPLEEIEEYSKKLGMDANMEFEDEMISVSLKDYLGIAGRISGSTYRLVYQDIRHGRIFVDREHVLKLIREYFYSNMKNFYDEMPADKARDITSPFAKATDTAKELFKSKAGLTSPELGEVESTKFPPCIKEYIKQVSEGVNIPHMARFTMVSFLHKIGLENQKIMDIFKTAPDFNEKVTTYQVNHITGETSGTQYSPPKCVNLQSNHLCYKGEDPLCNTEWLKHPMRYYEIKKSSRSESKK